MGLQLASEGSPGQELDHLTPRALEPGIINVLVI